MLDKADKVVNECYQQCRGYSPTTTELCAVFAEEIRKYIEALRWCGGSADFAPGGVAWVGWLKLVVPLIEEDKPPEEPTPPEPTVTAGELAELQRDSRMLLALEDAGVVTWDGYREAVRKLRVEALLESKERVLRAIEETGHLGLTQGLKDEGR